MRPSRWAARSVLAFFTVMLGGCASLRTLDRACGTGSNARVCTGPVTRIPDGRAADFARAGQLAIDIVHSDEFLDRLRDYMRRHPAPAGDTAWAGLTPEGITAALRARLPGLEVATFGGIGGWWRARFSGNTGLDGGDHGPVLVNRFALGSRRTSQIANTIVHEAAHRAGMKHPASEVRGGLPRAFCQPPYVIGTLVERTAEGPGWTWNDSQHCATFRRTP